MSGTKALCAW